MGNKVTMDVIAGVNVDSAGLTVNASGSGIGARSSVGVKSGKVYFEVSVYGHGNIGLCDETNILTTIGWQNTSSFIVQYGWNVNTKFFINNTNYPYSNPINLDLTAKNTVGFSLDMDNYILSIFLNGIRVMDSFELKGKLSNLGTKLYPFLFNGGGGGCNNTTEWNFGATPFKYLIPEGYTSYDGNQGNTKKYLLKDDEGYKNLTELISTEIPTEDQFKEKGMSDIPSYGQLSNFNDLVTYTTDNLSKSLVKFKPKAKTILSTGAINFSGKELKKVSLIGTDNVRVLFSKDRGVTWHNKTSNIVSEIKDHDDGTVIGTGVYGICEPWRAFIRSGTIGYEGMWYTYTNKNSNYLDHHWLQYDFGTGNEQVVTGMSFATGPWGYGYMHTIKAYSVSGSLNGINFIKLGEGIVNVSETNAMFDSSIPYRYIRVDAISYEPHLNEFALIMEAKIYGSTIVPISDISTQGLTPTQLTAITPEEWKAFMGDSSTLRFAYYLPDETANTDKLELTVDFIGE